MFYSNNLRGFSLEMDVGVSGKLQTYSNHSVTGISHSRFPERVRKTSDQLVPKRFPSTILMAPRLHASFIRS